MRLGYLDIQGVLEDTIELAPIADQLGFSRYWLTEFPPQPSPIPIVAVLGGLTERIRVGTAAILFHYYAPKRTAHEFQLLERLYPGRIDAGVCSSTAAPPLVADDLDGRDPAEQQRRYGERFAILVKHLRNTPTDPAFQPELAWNGTPEDPPLLWSLGQGGSAAIAAQHGTAFGYPLMYANSVDSTAVIEEYRARFTPSRQLAAPYTVVAVCGVCGDSDETAKQMARAGKIFVPRIIGSPATCAAALADLRRRYQADEVIWADMAPGFDARKRSLELLAAAAAETPELG